MQLLLGPPVRTTDTAPVRTTDSEALVRYGVGVMTSAPKNPRHVSRQVLVELEPHAERRLPRARSAA
jgi:hypothetical protein